IINSTGGGSSTVTFGAASQIPYMDATATDFTYNSKLKWDTSYGGRLVIDNLSDVNFPNKSMLNETSLSFRNDKNTGIVTQRLLSLTRLSDISPVASLNATIVDGLFSKWGFIASSGILFEANSNGSLKAP